MRDDFDSERSDVDLLVEFERFDDSNPLETYFRLQEALEEVFERKVDLIEAGSVRNPYTFSTPSSATRRRCMQRDLRAFLSDIEEAAKEILQFTRESTAEDYAGAITECGY